MDIKKLLDVHPLLADRIRLAIMVTIASAKKETDFITLLEVLELSRGNLSSHISKLSEANFLEVKKEFVDKRPRTSFTVTKEGKSALAKYLSAVEEAVGGTRK